MRHRLRVDGDAEYQPLPHPTTRRPVRVTRVNACEAMCHNTGHTVVRGHDGTELAELCHEHASDLRKELSRVERETAHSWKARNGWQEATGNA